MAPGVHGVREPEAQDAEEESVPAAVMEGFPEAATLRVGPETGAGLASPRRKMPQAEGTTERPAAQGGRRGVLGGGAEGAEAPACV